MLAKRLGGKTTVIMIMSALNIISYFII